jgi:uncharacterized protein YprB with RNaseH-like and TPR domain
VETQTNEAYLDIETTGLNHPDADIVVLGLNRVGIRAGLVQIVGKGLTGGNVLDALAGVEVLYTFGGTRFDLPLIEATLGLNLASLLIHHDLTDDCRQHELYGGLSMVEANLGIVRQLNGIVKSDAAMLWHGHVERGNRLALALLMQYNKENVLSLKILRDRLDRP